MDEAEAPSHKDAADKRGCDCGLWDTKPEVLRGAGLPEGFCGKCEKCGQPGHMQHFPGAVPSTGAWCAKHHRLLVLFDPRTGTGCLPWIVLFGLMIVAYRALPS